MKINRIVPILTSMIRDKNMSIGMTIKVKILELNSDCKSMINPSRFSLQNNMLSQLLKGLILVFSQSCAKSVILFWISGVKSCILSIGAIFVVCLIYINLIATLIYEIESLFVALFRFYSIILQHFTLL